MAVDPPSILTPVPPRQTSCSPSKPQEIRFSLARCNNSPPDSNGALPLLRKFFHCLFSTTSITILPIRKDSTVLPLTTASQVNGLTTIGVQSFFKASKSTSRNIAEDYHISTSLFFAELSNHQKVINWLTLQGYHLVLCDCQTSDMIKIGFLTRVRPFVWREDLKELIISTSEWRIDPFHFCMFPGSLSCNTKGVMAPVMMIEIKRDMVETGLEYFCSTFDGENPLSTCGTPYLFFTLYQIQLTDTER